MNDIITTITDNLDLTADAMTADDWQRVRAVLEDGEALASLGITDDDQDAVEEAHAMAISAITKSQIISELSAIATRSAWDRGVRQYAIEMVEELDAGAVLTAATVRAVVLNGAEDARQYSEGGCTLIYDCDIAERLCTPSELRRKKGGELPPNRNESWLDVQTRAIHQAIYMIARAAKRAERSAP